MSKKHLLQPSWRQATVLAALAFTAHTAHAGDLPDRGLTPGALNPEVTQDNIDSTICTKGYTKRIRPPAHVTNRLKKRQIAQYGYSDTNSKLYEEDHLIALSIGGAPDDERNLWPEPRNSQWGAGTKDRLEFVMQRMVCRREVTLDQAQKAMAGNWIDAYRRYIPLHPNWQYQQ